VRYLITGGSGFVMSAFVEHLLEADPGNHVTTIDTSPAGPPLHRGRPGAVQQETADVRDQKALNDTVSRTRPEVLVHAATVTSVPGLELVDPARFLDVNATGTLRVIAAAHAGGVGKIVLVSSAAVYGAGTRDTAIPECRLPVPDDLYGISKIAAEAAARRFAELTGIALIIVRLSKVFGPMEKPTATRQSMSGPFHVASAAVADRPLAVTPRTFDAAADWISSIDVARGLSAVCDLDTAPLDIFNIGSGHLTGIVEIAESFGTELVRTDRVNAELDLDPSESRGKHGFLDVARMADLGWTPRPIRDQVLDYRRWALENRGHFIEEKR
jgi:nucleoside-diphosphate-sugar epimerase